MMRPDRRTILIGTAGLLVLVVAVQLLPESEPPVPNPVEAVPLPVPAPVASTPPPVTAPSVSPEGLRLFGVTGAGAIIGMPNGAQRLVAIGRDVLPGLVLQSVAVDHALLRSSSGTYQLGFTGVAAVQSTGQASPQGPAPGSDVALREETRSYRLGLARREENGQVTGHVVRERANLPALARAGLRPGDVILRVNGSRFDGERLEELAWTIANSNEVTFEVERNGQPMRFALSK